MTKQGGDYACNAARYQRVSYNMVVMLVLRLATRFWQCCLFRRVSLCGGARGDCHRLAFGRKVEGGGRRRFFGGLVLGNSGGSSRSNWICQKGCRAIGPIFHGVSSFLYLASWKRREGKSIVSVVATCGGESTFIANRHHGSKLFCFFQTLTFLWCVPSVNQRLDMQCQCQYRQVHSNDEKEFYSHKDGHADDLVHVSSTH